MHVYLPFAFVNFICILTPGSKCVGTLHISVCKRPTISISLLCLGEELSSTLTVTILTPLGVVGVPEMTPSGLMVMPSGSPVAVNV